MCPLFHMNNSTVYNFGAGPAMLPRPVMEQVQSEFLDYQNTGVSLIEMSHRDERFTSILYEIDDLFRELTDLPDNYKMLYMHGGAQMQFSAIPLNLINLKPEKRAGYILSGNFSEVAYQEAQRYGSIDVCASSKDQNYNYIPDVSHETFGKDYSYIYLTGNNTVYGTQWQSFPKTDGIPLVMDATSEILSRKLDYSQFGLVFAGAQKNLGPSGISLLAIRDDLIGHDLPETPKLLSYQLNDQQHSQVNTTNTFAIYVVKLVLQWLKDQGGVVAVEKENRKKAKHLYDLIDQTDFYRGFSSKKDRSIMNVTFNLPTDDLLKRFLIEAESNGLFALKGHRVVGGVRTSIYNAMPYEGVKVLGDFMKEFERKNG